MEYDNITNLSTNNEVLDNDVENHLCDIVSDTNTVDKYLRKRSKQYYPSNYNGLHINNAETGEIYLDIIGSMNEKKYFRVIDSTGTINSNGQVCYGIKTSNKLFYKNAEQYINHRNRKYNKDNNVNNI